MIQYLYFTRSQLLIFRVSGKYLGAPFFFQKNQNIRTRMNNFSFSKPIYSGNTGFLNTCGSMKFYLRLSSSFVEVLCYW